MEIRHKKLERQIKKMILNASGLSIGGDSSEEEKLDSMVIIDGDDDNENDDEFQ